MSDIKVVAIADRRREQAKPGVIEACRELLRRAEEGEIHGIAAVTVNVDGCITTVIETDGQHFAVSHGLSALWFRFQQRMADSAFDPSEDA